MAQDASAAENEYYDSNNNLYRVENGVLTISKSAIGTGVIPDCSNSSNIIQTLGISQSFTTVMMDSTITAVGRNSFKECMDITGVTMTGVTSIDGAFNTCVSLASVSLSQSLVSIGSMAFAACDSLVLSVLPDDVTSVGAFAFYGCTSLTSMTIPAGVTSIGSNAFRDCDDLASINMQGTTPPTIGTSSFPTTTTIYVPAGTGDAYRTAWSAYAQQIQESGPTVIKDSNNNEYSVTDGVLTITKGTSGTGVMPNFTSSSTVRTLVGEDFTSVVMAEGMTNVGSSAFYDLTALTDITMPSVTSIGNSAFRGCTNLALTSLPSGITSIGNSAFRGCTNLALTSLPSGITTIKDNAFYRCTSLALTSLPSGITSIGNSAFQGCTNLATLTVQSNINTIGSSAFWGCSNLTSIKMSGTTPPTIDTNSFPTTTTIYVPHGTGNAYKSSWSAYADQIVELADPIRKMKLMCKVDTSRLPSGYKEVEYIQSSGSQCIDTGFAINTIGKQEFGLMRVSSGSRGLMGANGSSPNYFGWSINNCYEFNLITSDVEASNTSFDDVEWNMTTKTLSVNDTVLITASNNFGKANMSLLSINGGHGMSAKMSYARLYDTSNVLIGDYVPCIRQSDNAVGMYDLVSNTFKANAGSDTFTDGPEVIRKTVKTMKPMFVKSALPDGYTEVEYIQSGGYQCIDTGIIPTINTKARVKFSAVATNGAGFFGARKDGDYVRFCATTFSSGSQFAFAMTTNYWSNNKTRVVVGDVYDCTAYNGKQIINGTEYDETVLSSLNPTTCTFKLAPTDGSGNVISATNRYYLCQIWESGTLTFDGVPCVYHYGQADAVVGMYDLVSKSFKTNSGSGGFTAGNPVTTRFKTVKAKVMMEVIQ